MELRSEIEIEAPAAAVWQVLGERFHGVADWAAPIGASCAVGEGSPGVGGVRACQIGAFGPVKAGTVKERLTRFDREEMAFEYEAIEGMPRFVRRAVNRWSVHALGAGRSVVRIHATLTLRGPVALMGCLVKWQMAAGGARVAEELKYFVENGRPHPRKVAATRDSRAGAAG